MNQLEFTPISLKLKYSENIFPDIKIYFNDKIKLLMFPQKIMYKVYLEVIEV